VVLAVAVLAAAVAGPGATIVDAREPPRPVCELCDDGALASAAADRGVDLETGASRVTVAVRADGDTRWTVRIGVTAGASALANDSLRAAVVADVTKEAAGRERRRAIQSRLDGDTLVVTYRRDDAAERAFGAVLFTDLHASDPVRPFVGGGDGTAYPAADTLVVRGPDGYVPAGGAGDGAVDGRTVRWSGAEGGDDPIDRGAVPTFVPESAAFSGLRGAVARLLAGY
jgi:hypothetical protein